MNRLSSRVCIAVVGLLCASCVSHPVGPARTYAKYEGKAVTTAEGVLSAINTARLMAQATAHDNSFGPYSDAIASESEDAASGLEGTFGSIQPPNRRADRLRHELNEMIGDAVDHLAALRVAVRRGEHDRAASVAKPLHDDAKRLSDFIDEHQK